MSVLFFGRGVWPRFSLRALGSESRRRGTIIPSFHCSIIPMVTGDRQGGQMRAVVQRVKGAKVEVEGKTVGEIDQGLLVLLGVGEDDSEKDCEYLANKIAHLRIFSDDQGLMNLSLVEIQGGVLVVSQFTLWGDCRKGRRPSFTRAARPEKARELYEHFVGILRGKGLRTATGEFQEMMDVHLVNDGPVTLVLDSSKTFY